jgi:hypothetical protein
LDRIARVPRTTAFGAKRKPTAQEALWFQGGNLQQARHFSPYLALQIKARMEGLPTPVYQTETGSL